MEKLLCRYTIQNYICINEYSQCLSTKMIDDIKLQACNTSVIILYSWNSWFYWWVRFT